MKMIRKLLFPIVPIYWLVTWFRNKLYDWGLKKSESYDFPVIAVGNISVGGTGKTPMIEYLIELLKDDYELATLSRGYGRVTKGFVVADKNATSLDLGDEPMQFYQKYTAITVAVDGNRRRGIRNLRKLNSNPEVILLDDAYQHRRVKAGFYILLTSYYNLYSKDIVLPTGDLREPRSGANRADVIVVTKCPENLTQAQKESIAEELMPEKTKQLFFSTISYSDYLYSAGHTMKLESLKNSRFALLTGIANPKPMLDYYTSKGLQFEHLNYPDHHNFSDKEITSLKEKNLIVTTEKDYMRLKDSIPETKLWYHPIKTKFIGDQQLFDSLINNAIKKQDS